MGRKKYEDDMFQEEVVDSDNEKYKLNENIDKTEENRLQKQYEISLNKYIDKFETFETKNFDQLYSMYYEIKDNIVNIEILEKCTLNIFIKFIEKPVLYETTKYNENNINYWESNNNKELKKHYKNLIKYFKLMNNITYNMFVNFCFSHSVIND